MYYHNSPTPKQLKALKRARAIEMKKHLANMQMVTGRYQATIEKLERLREQELLIENELSTGRLEGDRLAEAQAIIERNRRKANRLVLKLLPDFTLEEQ